MVEKPLQGVAVCIAVASDVVNDGRVRKEARSLVNAGAIVTVVGQGRKVSPSLADEPYRVVLASQRLAKTIYSLLQRRYIRSVVKALKSVVRALRPGGGRSFSVRSMPKFYNAGMVDLIVAAKPDVVHAHNVYTLTAATKAADQVGAKLIYDARELFDGYFRQAWALKMGAQEQADQIETLGMARADGVLTVSPLIAAHLEKRFGREDITVLYNSLPFEEMSPEPVHQPVRILNQAGFRSTTWDHLIVEAMVHLRDVATLTMQGRFQRQDYREYVEEIIAKNGLQEVVTLTGEYDPLDSIRLAHGFDVGVGTYQPDTVSKDLTLANRFFTYLNAGVALALPDVAAHRDFPGYGEYGILLDTTNAETIAASLRPLLEDPARISAMKRAALAAAPEYSWDRQSEKLVELYRRVLGS